MNYRSDPRSGNRLSSLGFGCMRLPMKLGRPDVDAAEKLLLEAVAQGINYFDTAYLYSGSEECLGEVFDRNPGLRDQVFLATKLPHTKCRSLADFTRLFETSLSRLRTNHIDYYLIHNVTSFQQWERLVEVGVEDWIAAEKAAGRIRQIGFSWHGPYPEFERMIGAYDWDFCQIQYNYVNENYQAGRAGLNLAAQAGLPVIIMEPLLGGKLADSLPPEAERVFKEAEPQSSNASWGLRWLWDQPEVTVVLSGMNEPGQLADNLTCANAVTPHSLTDEQRDTIAAAKAAFEKTFRVPCTGCNYCMPCPKGINIPACFAAYNESFSLGWFTGAFHYFISAGVTDEHLHFASQCVECGACERHCPQGIAIRQELRNVRKRLQPPGSVGAAHLFFRITR